MNRREFLTSAGSVIVVLPAGYVWAACSSKSGGSPPASGGSSMAGSGATAGGSTLTFTSSASGTPVHTHTFGLMMSAIDSPPASGVSGNTSTNSGHNHMVSLTAAQLTMIKQGMTVSVDTTGGNHTHTFMFHT